MVQKWPFFQIFFLGNIGQENFFYDILQKKNACLGYKNKKFKKSKNRHFFKEVNQWFWSGPVLVQKWSFFQLFFYGNIGQENVFYDIPHRKNAFVANKKKSWKSRKTDFFFKGVNPYFWSKNRQFFNFFFLGNIGQENVCLRYSRPKKRLSRL